MRGNQGIHAREPGPAGDRETSFLTSGPSTSTRYKYGLSAFFDEARILAGINHPNIAQVLELVRANETIYMVMQFIEGTSLKKHIQSHRGRAASQCCPRISSSTPF